LWEVRSYSGEMLPSEEAPERRDNSVISGGNKKSYSYTASHDQTFLPEQQCVSIASILVPDWL
jgi:hypothetical protein